MTGGGGRGSRACRPCCGPARRRRGRAAATPEPPPHPSPPFTSSSPFPAVAAGGGQRHRLAPPATHPADCPRVRRSRPSPRRRWPGGFHALKGRLNMTTTRIRLSHAVILPVLLAGLTLGHGRAAAGGETGP